MPIRSLRKKISLDVKNIASEIDVHEKSVYKLERNFLENSYFKYIKLLRKKGVDMNKFLDEL